MTRQVKCPNCGKAIEWTPENPWRPFCSERCKLIDLGEWASEGHRIPGPAHHSPDDENEGGESGFN